MTRGSTYRRVGAGIVCMALGLAAGCTPAASKRGPMSDGRAAPAPLIELTGGRVGCAPNDVFCDELDHGPEGTWGGGPPDLPLGVLPAGTLTRDGSVQLGSPASPASWRAKLVVPLASVTGSPTAGYADVDVHGRALRVITAATPPGARAPRDRRVLNAGGRSLAQVRLIEEVQIAFSNGAPALGAVGFTLEDRAVGVVVGHLDLDFDDKALPPTTCPEKALVRFGPIPWNMPPIALPEIEDCEGERCITATEAWIRGTHHVWRLGQMFAYMDDLDSIHRSFIWGQPATDEAGEPIGLAGSSTSPKHWFGNYSDERYDAIREGVLKLWGVFANAETKTIDVHLQCPDPDENPGNVCFVTNSYGHHSVLGWINLCSEAFQNPLGLDGSVIGAVTHTTIHEAAHHQKIHFDAGVRYLHDIFTHGHGGECATNIDTTSVDDLSQQQHMVTYVAADGEGCWHRNYAAQAIESYSLFAMRIGEGVRDGELYAWPKLADPTPVPPDCDGEIGCQCVPLPPNQAPDGDYSITRYCADHEAQPTVCMKTKFNATDTVGVCTNCADRRGPGCPCNDLTLPCDEGACWGDDTGGPSNATGTCYRDPPPSWGCLVSCEALMGAGAFCLHDHPGGARCVPYGTGLPHVFDCWEDGGYYSANSECATHECGPAAVPAPATCQDLGYPSYFVCDGSFRCVPDL
jgi:hypothetical protein